MNEKLLTKINRTPGRIERDKRSFNGPSNAIIKRIMAGKNKHKAEYI